MSTEPDRPDEPRVALVDSLTTEQLTEMWEQAAPPDLSNLTHFNVVRTMAHHPDLLARYLTFGMHLRRRSSLSDRLRTLVSLRTAAFAGSTYEWSKHAGHATRGKMLTPDEIEATRTGDDVATWSPLERAVLSAVAELCQRQPIDDDTWAVLAAELDVRQQLDLVFTVGHYVMLATVLHGLRVPDED